LELREATLEDERADLATAKGEITTLIAELQAVRDQATQALAGLDEVDEERLVEVAKRLDSMKSQAAAGALTALLSDDEDRAVAVFERMNRSKAGKLLSSLSSEVAATLLERSSRPVALAGP